MAIGAVDHMVWIGALHEPQPNGNILPSVALIGDEWWMDVMLIFCVTWCTNLPESRVKSKYFTLAELSPENFNGNTLLFLGPKGTDSDASLYSSCARISASLKLSQLHAPAAFFSKGKLRTCYWKRRFQVHLPPCDRHGWMLCERVSFWKLHRILVRRKVVEKPLTNHRQTGESRWRAMLGLMSRLFAFLAHVQAVQPVAGPFFYSLAFG